MTRPTDIAEAIRATWPPKTSRTVGPFEVLDGAGGGNRVSAARLTDPAADGGKVTPGMIAEVENTRGDTPLFMVFGWQDPLDDALAALGYTIRDETVVLAATIADIAEPPPPVSCFEVWPPLAVQEELWAEGDIGPARLAVMDRAAGPKTALFGRINDRPAGTAFMAVHEKTAMLHALEVTPTARRQGLARIMVGAGAAWAAGHGAEVLSVLVTRANDPAQRLYASLGLKPVEKYHYRVK